MYNVKSYIYMKAEKQKDFFYENGRPWWCLHYYKTPVTVLDQNGDDIKMEPDSIYISIPNVPCRYCVNGSSCIHTTITFDADMEYMAQYKIPYMTPIHIKETKELEQLMFDMYKHTLTQSEFINRAQNAYLVLLLIHIHNCLYNHPKDYSVNAGDDLQQLRNTIMNSTQIPWSVETMAAFANTSTRNFQRKYKELYGKTPIADLYDFRFIKAKRLLDDGFSINHVLNSCCFKSPQHFSIFFKKRAGITPTEYRNRTKSKEDIS